MVEDSFNPVTPLTYYQRRVKRAEQRGEIIYGTALRDHFAHIREDGFSPSDANCRNIGVLGKIILEKMRRYRNPMHMLFLGAGAGRGCFDAYNLVTDYGGEAHISTAALTPVAPDIHPLIVEEQICLATDQFIERQYIGDYVHAALDSDINFDVVYDQLGPMLHCDNSTDRTDRTVQRHATMLQKSYERTSALGCIAQERIDKVYAGEILQTWHSCTGENDLLIFNTYAAVLIRDARLLLEGCMQHTYVEEYGNGSYETKLEQELKRAFDRLLEKMS